ncbi:MAG: hypothetical protein AB7O04_04765 [Hyphomonadaceae bacterium]
MSAKHFQTPLQENEGVLEGPWRHPRNILNEQTYDGHASIHDDETAKKLGFKGGAVEGPTHFSQIAPLGDAIWGDEWWRTGCISAHYRNPVFDGEQVQPFLKRPAAGADIAEIWALKEDGSEVFRGTASVRNAAPTELETRLATLPPLEKSVILRDVKIGAVLPRRPAKMGLNQHMGPLYPFTLADKLKVITETADLYESAAAAKTSFGRAAIPMEMISVLIGSISKDGDWPTKGPAVGLFADQEIRLFNGPLFVDEPFEIEREVVALSGSRRTESIWVRTKIFRPGELNPAAAMLLNQAILVESYAPYAAEKAALYGA